MIKDEPAFPLGSGDIRDPVGMTLRDYFAAKVMQTLCQFEKFSVKEDIARLSYEMADAMLKERMNERTD